MRSLILSICLISMTTNASNLPNAVEDTSPPFTFVLDIDIDCDYNPKTDEVSNCKVVAKSDE